MDERLYIRLRGRVQGPFDPDRLRELVRQGQLSRIHQVSVDKVDWVAASEYPELFPSSSESKNWPKKSGRVKKSKGGDPGGEWFYSDNGEQRGPVGLDRLTQMLASGELGADTHVWTESLSDWTRASDVAQLGASPASDTRGGGGQDPNLERTLRESRSWVLGVAVCLYLGGALLLVAGAVGVVYGVKSNQALLMAGGFNVAAAAGVLLWAAQLVTSINIRMGRYLQDKRVERLDNLLRSIRSFWVFTCIVLVLLFINLLFATLWLASIGVSLRGGALGLDS